MSGLTIGEVAGRTGLAVSAIRYYEEQAIVHPLRNAGGHRRYDRSDIRRLSFVIIAQRLGFTLGEIAGLLAGLPDGRAPTRRDWNAISGAFKARIVARIEALQELGARLDGCIGCGCLSLTQCALHNAHDARGDEGPGPAFLRDHPG